MTQPQTVEIDLVKILDRIEQKIDGVDNKVDYLTVELVKVKGDIKALDERVSGQIKALDEKLSGQIKVVDEKLSGQINALDEKVSGLSKRVEGVDFINRGVFVALIIAILGGFAKIFGFIGNP